MQILQGRLDAGERAGKHRSGRGPGTSRSDYQLYSEKPWAAPAVERATAYLAAWTAADHHKNLPPRTMSLGSATLATAICTFAAPVSPRCARVARAIIRDCARRSARCGSTRGGLIQPCSCDRQQDRQEIARCRACVSSRSMKLCAMPSICPRPAWAASSLGIPAEEDPLGRDAYSESGSCNKRSSAKWATPFARRFGCLFCEYTDHGHCGVVNQATGRTDVDNDATLALLPSRLSAMPRRASTWSLPVG